MPDSHWAALTKITKNEFAIKWGKTPIKTDIQGQQHKIPKQLN